MSAVTAFAILTFVMAYLAINTPEKHGPLQIGHYILIHVMVVVTAVIGLAGNSSSESTSDVIAGFVGAYSWMIYLVAAYFGIYMIVKALKFFGEAGE